MEFHNRSKLLQENLKTVRKKRSGKSNITPITPTSPTTPTTPTTTTFPTTQDNLSERKKKTKKVVTFLFSHLGLAVMVMSYSVMGGLLFQALEGSAELHEKDRVRYLREDTAGEIIQLAMHLNIHTLDHNNFAQHIRMVLNKYQEKIVEAVKLNGFNGKLDSDQSSIQWSFGGSLLYAVTVITTIGYGHVVPKTQAGRMVTILYALVGIPLTFLYLSNMGNFAAHCFRLFYKKVCCGFCVYVRLASHKRRMNKVRLNSEAHVKNQEAFNSIVESTLMSTRQAAFLSAKRRATTPSIGVDLNDKKESYSKSKAFEFDEKTASNISLRLPFLKNFKKDGDVCVSQAESQEKKELPLIANITSGTIKKTNNFQQLLTTSAELALKAKETKSHEKSSKSDASSWGKFPKVSSKNTTKQNEKQNKVISKKFSKLLKSFHKSTLLNVSFSTHPTPHSSATHHTSHLFRTHHLLSQHRKSLHDKSTQSPMLSRSSYHTNKHLKKFSLVEPSSNQLDLICKLKNQQQTPTMNNVEKSDPNEKKSLKSMETPVLKILDSREDETILDVNENKKNIPFNVKVTIHENFKKKARHEADHQITASTSHQTSDNFHESFNSEDQDFSPLPIDKIITFKNFCQRSKKTLLGIIYKNNFKHLFKDNYINTHFFQTHREHQKPFVKSKSLSSLDPLENHMQNIREIFRVKSNKTLNYFEKDLDKLIYNYLNFTKVPSKKPQTSKINYFSNVKKLFLKPPSCTDSNMLKTPRFAQQILRSKTFSRLRRKRRKAEGSSEEEINYMNMSVPISVCLMIIALYIYLGALLFSFWEGWDLLTGSYFCFITLSTIGFGDIVPGIDSSQQGAHHKLILCSLWLVVGLSLLAMCFNLMQEEVKEKFIWLGKKLGILRH